MAIIVKNLIKKINIYLFVAILATLSVSCKQGENQIADDVNSAYEVLERLIGERANDFFTKKCQQKAN